jgi:hypothetical protein
MYDFSMDRVAKLFFIIYVLIGESTNFVKTECPENMAGKFSSGVI